jgi:hypothetical protein
MEDDEPFTDDCLAEEVEAVGVEGLPSELLAL